MQFITIFLAICANCCLGQSHSYGKSGVKYPPGLENQMMCGRQNWMKICVCDPDRILGSHDVEASQLDELIKKIANETRCPCSSHSCTANPEGYKIGIAIAKKLTDDNFNLNNDDDQYDQKESQARLLARNLNEAQKFAQTVKQQWKLGRCEEDIIIFYSHEDKVVYTATGEVASRKLTKKLVQDIAINARMSGFSRSAFDGLYNIVNDYRAVLLDSYRPRHPKSVEARTGNGSSSFLTTKILILLVSLFVIYI